MSGLHTKFYSCLDIPHDGETCCTAEETYRLCCLLNKVLLFVGSSWDSPAVPVPVIDAWHPELAAVRTGHWLGDLLGERSFSAVSEEKTPINLGRDRILCPLGYHVSNCS